LRPDDFSPIDGAQARAIADSLNDEAFTRWLGLRFDEIRDGYARLTLAYRPEIEQGGGVVHGGAIASALDNVVLGAILSTLPERPRRAATIDLHVHFIDAVAREDVIAEARIRRRGKSIVFAEADARTPSGRVVAHAEACWRVSG
jgi:uncharacterized protein (TIGR00369 family)